MHKYVKIICSLNKRKCMKQLNYDSITQSFFINCYIYCLVFVTCLFTNISIEQSSQSTISTRICEIIKSLEEFARGKTNEIINSETKYHNNEKHVSNESFIRITEILPSFVFHWISFLKATGLSIYSVFAIFSLIIHVSVFQKCCCAKLTKSSF